MQGHGHTLGGVSKSVWSSFMRLFDPLTRNVPWISVAGDGRMSLAVVQRGLARGWLEHTVFLEIETTVGASGTSGGGVSLGSKAKVGK